MQRFYVFAFVGALWLLGWNDLHAQKIQFSVNMQVGMSRLMHNTRFESTTLRNLYETVALSHKEGYEWENFEADYQLRQSFMQYRYGFSLMATHRDIPLIAIGEAMSSSSTYERMGFGVTLGFGKQFFTLEDNLQCHFLGGFKLIWDKGFGANTLVNSIGHTEARHLVATYFDPKNPLGQTRGNLFVLRGGFAKTFDRDKQWAVGCEGYYELDVTPRIKRESRMTNMGAHLFVRFNLQKKRRMAAFNNNPNYYY